MIGETDAKGDPMKQKKVAASFFYSLGINPKKENYTPTGRPVPIIPNGQFIPEFFS